MRRQRFRIGAFRADSLSVIRRRKCPWAMASQRRTLIKYLSKVGSYLGIRLDGQEVGRGSGIQRT